MLLALIAALAGGLGLDVVAGDPPNRYHPVAWLGRLIGYFVPRLKAGSRARERAGGSAFAILIVALVGAGVHFAAMASLYLAGAVALAIFSAIILKVTVAVRGMDRHARAIMACLENGDLPGARQNLSMIVRRPTEDLDEQHVLSATIECVSESTVDGITGPVFYYSLLGPAGAFAYRAINTLDSMVGYKDDYYRDIGWMSARLDTLANYVPARITAFLMVVSARMLGADWKNSLGILQRDHGKTFSPNAGYPMATMAGALRIRLEKIGHYSLGDSQEQTTLQKCRMAISMMKLTTLLFFLAFSVPAMSVLYLAGWWRLLLGLP
ncbi:cobalamin biosynthesis protein [Nitrososphaera viennensis]|uniref:Probable cobalamin biosynthesis protein CobD n=2 Tax=Nitrososphaera viennensis TaxID=1034015 RepID=A0A060HT85_9ARCH|nr:cobalamin biosynthesis protein [Nitrososphaera viennensis]AIC16696.1 cobalamin biosynthesis protein CobD [Nitrososphaera viennensis EN76]UVS68617.1 cobalamin biosynthesis protein [Nitrososphaera viennensis]